ncbi:exported protein of unknown function [Kyrpidia spormannii]|uniref:Uncharacterized protein n=1 Tax=Kyrpidia spormannii TaxID=2055160 RepID=A0A6F9E645_9BACL|nr:exported protein of unknown function [Kyrpidia spormannii]
MLLCVKMCKPSQGGVVNVGKRAWKTGLISLACASVLTACGAGAGPTGQPGSVPPRPWGLLLCTRRMALKTITRR